ncbi:hypothetical protein N9L18_00980 [Candidatus Pacebacteria bacterium]|nr:hypothetical protein [Candidatus Paceibacterota bacterium]
MNKKQGIFILIIILILIVLGLYSFAKENSKKIEEAEMSPREEAIEDDKNRPEESIDLKHQYRDGEHIFAGKIGVPTPCHEVTAVVVPGDPAELQINTIAPSETEACAQVITEKEYKAYYKGEKEINFLATVDGKPVSLNQFEIPEGQNIDSVNILIKG